MDRPIGLLVPLLVLLLVVVVVGSSALLVLPSGDVEEDGKFNDQDDDVMTSV